MHNLSRIYMGVVWKNIVKVKLFQDTYPFPEWVNCGIFLQIFIICEEFKSFFYDKDKFEVPRMSSVKMKLEIKFDRI